MFKLIKRFFFNTAPVRVYIIPTIDGLKVFSINLILLVMGLIYANNYLLLFNFILFCLFTITMFYTHLNLQGLSIESINSLPCFLGDQNKITINFKKNFFGSRYSLLAEFIINDQRINSQDFNLLETNGWSSFHTQINKRGVYSVNRIKIETLFPLNLFRSFIYFDVHFTQIVYPEIHSSKVTGIDILSGASSLDNEINIKNYERGDRLNQILWRKIVNDEILVKTDLPTRIEGILFEIAPIVDLQELEKLLSMITKAILDCQFQNIPYGLKSKYKTINIAEHSDEHLKNCLSELAKYEA